MIPLEELWRFGDQDITAECRINFCTPTLALRQSTAKDLSSKFPVSNAYWAHFAYHYFTIKKEPAPISSTTKINYHFYMKNLLHVKRIFITATRRMGWTFNLWRLCTKIHKIHRKFFFITELTLDGSFYWMLNSS